MDLLSLENVVECRVKKAQLVNEYIIIKIIVTIQHLKSGDASLPRLWAARDAKASCPPEIIADMERGVCACVNTTLYLLRYQGGFYAQGCVRKLSPKGERTPRGE